MAQESLLFPGPHLHYIRMTELKSPCLTEISDTGVHQEQEFPNQLAEF